MNPSYANDVNQLYALGMESLGDPLSLVNRFLFYNIIVHSSLFQDLTEQETIPYFLPDQLHLSNDHYYIHSILPLLEEALEDLKPVKLKKDILAWENKQDKLLSTYKEYIKALGFEDGQDDGPFNYKIKHQSFLSKMVRNNRKGFALHPLCLVDLVFAA